MCYFWTWKYFQRFLKNELILRKRQKSDDDIIEFKHDFFFIDLRTKTQHTFKIKENVCILLVSVRFSIFLFKNGKKIKTTTRCDQVSPTVTGPTVCYLLQLNVTEVEFVVLFDCFNFSFYHWWHRLSHKAFISNFTVQKDNNTMDLDVKSV